MTDHTRYAHAPGVLSRRSLGRVLVRLPTGPLHTLPGTAAEVWDLLEHRTTVAEIVAALAVRYDAPAAGIGADVSGLIETLVAEGLAVPCPGDVARAPLG